MLRACSRYLLQSGRNHSRLIIPAFPEGPLLKKVEQYYTIFGIFPEKCVIRVVVFR